MLALMDDVAVQPVHRHDHLTSLDRAPGPHCLTDHLPHIRQSYHIINLASALGAPSMGWVKERSQGAVVKGMTTGPHTCWVLHDLKGDGTLHLVGGTGLLNQLKGRGRGRIQPLPPAFIHSVGPGVRHGPGDATGNRCWGMEGRLYCPTRRDSVLSRYGR